MRRTPLALLLTTLALGGAALSGGTQPAAAQLPGCGGLLQPPCPPPATTQPTTTTPAPTPPPADPSPTPAPAPAPAPPISPELFEDVEGFVASLLGTRAAYVRTCNGLSTSDPVLAAFRRRCRQDIRTVGLYERVADCDSAACFRRTLPPFARGLQVEARLLDALDRVVAAEVPAGPCRTAIQNAPENKRQFAQLVRGWTTLARAYRQRSNAVARQGDRQLDRVDFRKGRSSKAQLRDIRATCR